MSTHFTFVRWSAALFALTVCASAAANAAPPPADPEYRILRPSNTGIPGQNNMMFVTFGPDGRLWTHGRDFFWAQGGVAALDFESGAWRTYSSAETPVRQWCYDMAFAADGAAWIACENRVVRLHADGETFTTYTPANTGVLVTGSYGTIAISPDGHVWAANYGEVDLGGGLFEFDGEQWVKHEEPWMTTWTGVGIAPPLTVFARSNGDVWASFLSAPNRVGLYRNGQWTLASGAPFLIDLSETADGTLYGVGASGAYRLNDATGQWERFGTIASSIVALDPVHGHVFVNDGLDSVARYDGSSWSTFATFPGWVDAFTVGPDGDVWIAAETWPSFRDLHRYTPAGHLERVYNSINTGMPTYFPPGMHLDRDGRMWFTDSEYGASRLEPNDDWRNFGVYNGQEEVYPFWVFPVGLPWWQTPGADFWTESVDQVMSDSKGNTWLRGPNILARSHGPDLSQWDVWPPGQNGMPWLCDSMGEDAQGTIWLGDAYGAYRLVGAEWIGVPIGIPDQFAPVGFKQGGDGELYAARVSTVYHVDSAAITPIYTLPDGLGVITDLEVDASGRMWMGTPNDGAVFWNGTTATNFTPANSGLAELPVVDIAIRPADGVVAVATSDQQQAPYDGGVALFDGESWTAYDYGSSFLPHYAVGDVQFDADGHLWIGVLNFGVVQAMIGDAAPTPGDLDGDGDVDLADLSRLLTAFGTCDGDAGFDPAADIDGDGCVGLADLSSLLESFGL